MVAVYSYLLGLGSILWALFVVLLILDLAGML